MSYAYVHRERGSICNTQVSSYNFEALNYQQIGILIKTKLLKYKQDLMS